jgi:hypothetical protein
VGNRVAKHVRSDAARQRCVLAKLPNVRDAWQVGRHDPDTTGIREDDNPIIPSKNEKDAPVLEVLGMLRARPARGT